MKRAKKKKANQRKMKDLTIKIAFYKGKGKLHNKIIRWWTKSKYSHAELVLPDDVTWISISPFYNSKVSARPNPIYDKNKWDFLTFKINEDQYRSIIKFYDRTAGCRYDWIGMLLSQFLPFRIKQKGRWYCSEWIAYALIMTNVINWQKAPIFEFSDLSPGILYNMLIISDTSYAREELNRYTNSKLVH